MSARRATPEARCVWLDKGHVGRLQSIAAELPHNDAEFIYSIIRQQQAAPADPVEAAAKAVANGMGVRNPIGLHRLAADAVLVALGYPDGSPRQETPT